MDKKSQIMTRIFLFFSFLVLATASVLAFVLDHDINTLIPFPNYSIPIINTSCAFICLLAFIKTDWHWAQYLVAFVQSISTVLTGYEFLGLFLYSVLIILLFLNGAFKTKPLMKVSFLVSIWFVVNLGLIPFGRMDRMILIYVVSFFYGAFFFYVYTRLSYLLSPLLPASTVKTDIILPTPGSELVLKDYGLTERQIKFVTEYIKEGVSYNYLVEKYYVSLSTVKSEMASIFKIFGVKNKEDLRILLLQYRIQD